MGLLHYQPAARGGIFSFEYGPAWLKQAEALAFDPDLTLVEGPQYPAAERGSFGIFLDSSPDRWGRLLMQRRENVRARESKEKPAALNEWNYLLGVHDETRLGALRFQLEEGGPFVDADDRFAAPPITSLGELQAASLNFEQHIDEEDHPDYQLWLSQLFAPGTSLGGARPKASVRDERGVLHIAKFPSRNDERDVGAWELVAHRLAAKAGIDVPPTRGMQLPKSPYTTFLARRFDRTETERRLAFISAMTLVQRADGEPGASYLEFVELLQSRGVNTHRDCVELFRRVVFNILIHNTDDHLRNHGFLISREGISLSPVYDINPSLERNELALAINEVETACDISIAMDASSDYGISKKEADGVIQKVREAVSSWRAEATSLRIPKAEQELMAAAFDEGP
ncbi:MAG TPA: HipA domain-containing protein [Xanthobacteraceae bacterium]|jgi:serine/threonine-protein kinase HipA